MYIGVVVRVARIIDEEHWEEEIEHGYDYDPREYIGRLGFIRNSSESMVVVEFSNRSVDSFFPEELELVKVLNYAQKKPNLYRGMYYMTPFQKRLLAWIKKKGGEAEVAALTGIPKETMIGWVKRGSYPREDLWELLSPYVGMSVSEIMLDYNKRLQYRRDARPPRPPSKPRAKKSDAAKKSD